MEVYSQLGQELILRKSLKRIPVHFYVDVGCHHPVENSNTYYFYKSGGKGICIDPNPKFKEEFKKYRPDDIFVCTAVSDEKSDALTYYEYNNSQWNGLAPNLGQKHRLIGTSNVPVRPLNEILIELNAPSVIEILSIDTEGYELNVLKSIDYDQFSIRRICLESRMTILEHLQTDIHEFLSDRYTLTGHTGHDAFYSLKVRNFEPKHRLQPRKKVYSLSSKNKLIEPINKHEKTSYQLPLIFRQLLKRL